MRSGDIFVAEPGASEADGGLTACIPLKLDGKVTGAVAIYRLLPQKSGFERSTASSSSFWRRTRPRRSTARPLHRPAAAQEVAQ